MISAKLMLPLLLLAVVSTVPFTASAKECPALLNHSQTKLNSVETVSLCEAFQGNVLLIVNTASQCGFTPQLSGLETLYNTYKDRGFTVIGFPSNDFRQDRGSEANTAKVCYLDYGVTFPMMSRSSIKGEGSNPVFKALKASTGVAPRWNFFKYVVDRNGVPLAVFSSSTSPTDSKITNLIESAL